MSEHPERAGRRTPRVSPEASPATSTLSGAGGLRTPGAIARRRLLEMLGRLRPLTVVSAPAGYGKSTLVESWVAQTFGDVTVAQVSLECNGLSREAWWATLEGALNREGVAVSRRDVTGGLMDPQRGRIKELAADIVAHGRRVTLILDCGEFSMTAQVGRDMDRLIRETRTSLTVLMLTREDPPLPLHRFRLEGDICEIRAGDLAFTASEVAALMKGEGVVLNPRDVSALRARTGGWPAGLRFAAMSLRGRSDVSEAIDDFRGDTGNVAEFLMSEVLARQSSDRRRFLLRSCIIERLDPPLVKVLTGQHCDVQVLEAMADGGCFVERIPGQHGRFRYHALFRQFLLAQLSFEKSSAPAELHGQAAQWLARDGQTSLAVRHAVAATDWALACRLLVASLGFVEVLNGPRRTVLRRLFADLPPGLNGFEAALIRAALSLGDIDATTALVHLDDARAALTMAASPPGHSGEVALAVLSAVQTSLAFDTEEALDVGLDSALRAEKALRLLPGQAHLGVQSHLAALVAGSKGRALFARGEFIEAGEAFWDGVRTADAARLDGLAGELKGMCALVEAIIGRLRRATALATQVCHTRAVTGDRGPVPTEAARLALAWVRTDEAEPVLAHELVGQARREVPSYDSSLLATVATLLRARLLADQGDLPAALAELRVASGPRSALPPGARRRPSTRGWMARTLLASQADALTRLGRPREAIELIHQAGDERHALDIDAEIALQRARLTVRDPARDLARLATSPSGPTNGSTPLGVRIARSLVLAEGSIADRDLASGGHHLDQALRMAAPERLRRPILQAPRVVQELLTNGGLANRNRWLHPPSDGLRREQATVQIPGQGRARDEYGSDASEGVVGIPLTNRETEVLGYLAKLLTTDEIAAAMFVSVNTVRSHVRSILRKLGVSRRNEAVRRAWERQLIPPDSAA
jgi:LuxR family transcriptional regulator, maltose regulon positive regulatory protein